MSHVNIPFFLPHMGCRHQCVYCDQRIIASEQLPTEEEFHEKIQHYLQPPQKAKTIEIAFFGGSFTALPLDVQEKYLTLAAGYVGTGPICGIRFSTRPDAIDHDVMDFLEDYPVTTVEIGVQSADEQVLVASQRGHDLVDILMSASIVKRRGYQLGIQMMTGLPGDDYERSVYTAEKIVAMKPHFVRIYPTLVLKGTPLEKMMEQGEYIPWEMEETLELTDTIMSIFLREGIQVVRLGLYSENPNFSENVIAGPYHPALKSLVLSRMFRNRLEDRLVGKGDIRLKVSPRDISSVYGHGGQNRQYFLDKYQRRLCVEAEEQLPRYCFEYDGHRLPLYKEK